MITIGSLWLITSSLIAANYTYQFLSKQDLSKANERSFFQVVLATVVTVVTVL